MQIWVDADACPGEIKELLFRAAKRTKTKVTLVANQALRTPPSEFIDSLLVPAGMNVADRRIVELAQSGDLVVTADIPLAAEVVAKGGQPSILVANYTRRPMSASGLPFGTCSMNCAGEARSPGDHRTSPPRIGRRSQTNSIAG
jgi:hypothetical protein